MLPLTYEVTLYGETGEPVHALISAFCQACGARRGSPEPNSDGTHTWVNPCGHIDTPKSLMLEIDCQCSEPNCTLMYSDLFYPYCSGECAGQDGDKLIEHINRMIGKLDTFIEINDRIRDFPEYAKTQIDTALQYLKLTYQTLRAAAEYVELAGATYVGAHARNSHNGQHG